MITLISQQLRERQRTTEKQISLQQLLTQYVEPALEKKFPYAGSIINIIMLLNIIRPMSAMDKRRDKWIQQRGAEHYALAKRAIENHNTPQFEESLNSLVAALVKWYAEDSPKGIVNRQELRRIDRQLIKEAGLNLSELEIQALSSRVSAKDKPVVKEMKNGFKLAYAEMYYMSNVEPLQNWEKEYRWFYKNSKEIKRLYDTAVFLIKQNNQYPIMSLEEFQTVILPFSLVYEPELRTAFDNEDLERIIYMIGTSEPPVNDQEAPQSQPAPDLMVEPTYRKVFDMARQEGFLPETTIVEFKRMLDPTSSSFEPEMKSAYDRQDIETMVLLMTE